jgi:hypothetical protein
MKKENIYSSKNVISLVTIFVVIFWLLYALGSFLHESKKIQDEIEAIRTQNEQNLVEIKEKEKHLEYLKTPQRVDKEAKIQMGRKLPGEHVLVFIEEKLDIIPAEKLFNNPMLPQAKKIHPIEKWRWVFLGKR